MTPIQNLSILVGLDVLWIYRKGEYHLKMLYIPLLMLIISKNLSKSVTLTGSPF